MSNVGRRPGSSSSITANTHQHNHRGPGSATPAPGSAASHRGNTPHLAQAIVQVYIHPSIHAKVKERTQVPNFITTQLLESTSGDSGNDAAAAAAANKNELLQQRQRKSVAAGVTRPGIVVESPPKDGRQGRGAGDDDDASSSFTESFPVIASVPQDATTQDVISVAMEKLCFGALSPYYEKILDGRVQLLKNNRENTTDENIDAGRRGATSSPKAQAARKKLSSANTAVPPLQIAGSAAGHAEQQQQQQQQQQLQPITSLLELLPFLHVDDYTLFPALGDGSGAEQTHHPDGYPLHARLISDGTCGVKFPYMFFLMPTHLLPKKGMQSLPSANRGSLHFPATAATMNESRMEEEDVTSLDGANAANAGSEGASPISSRGASPSSEHNTADEGGEGDGDGGIAAIPGDIGVSLDMSDAFAATDSGNVASFYSGRIAQRKRKTHLLFLNRLQKHIRAMEKHVREKREAEQRAAERAANIRSLRGSTAGSGMYNEETQENVDHQIMVEAGLSIYDVARHGGGEEIDMIRGQCMDQAQKLAIDDVRRRREENLRNIENKRQLAEEDRLRASQKKVLSTREELMLERQQRRAKEERTALERAREQDGREQRQAARTIELAREMDAYHDKMQHLKEEQVRKHALVAEQIEQRVAQKVSDRIIHNQQRKGVIELEGYELLGEVYKQANRPGLRQMEYNERQAKITGTLLSNLDTSCDDSLQRDRSKLEEATKLRHDREKDVEGLQMVKDEESRRCDIKHARRLERLLEKSRQEEIEEKRRRQVALTDGSGNNNNSNQQVHSIKTVDEIITAGIVNTDLLPRSFYKWNVDDEREANADNAKLERFAKWQSEVRGHGASESAKKEMYMSHPKHKNTAVE